MKNKFSIISCCIISLVLIGHRLIYSKVGGEEIKISNYDGFGYYMYLPSAFIYNDFCELDWLEEKDAEYNLTGGLFYQAHRSENGNYVNKYLGGVSLLQMPFFFVGHAIALSTDYKADGFSPPYQYSIAFGALLYCILALFLLRKILLRYYDDLSVSISLPLLFLGTNMIQYMALEGGLSHVYIFPLYVLLIHFTIKWHENPTAKSASIIGYIIGLAAICRPTELVMIFVPLLWLTQNKAAKQLKWQMVKDHKKHVYLAILFGFIGVLPQLLYWQYTSGFFIYNVGSSWRFLTPFFQVLFGWGTGWFIYTPITILFIVGFFFLKNQPFRRSVIIFCLLNIWIIISWADWKYGAQYSTRALTQSFPLFALPLTAVVQRITQHRMKYLFYGIGLLLISLNIFQIEQYGRGILHHRDMNRKYYASVFLDMHPTPLDMSLLDTDEIVCDPENYHSTIRYQQDELLKNEQAIDKWILLHQDLREKPVKSGWINIKAAITTLQGYQNGTLNCLMKSNGKTKLKKIRLANAVTWNTIAGKYEFYVQFPEWQVDELFIFIESEEGYLGKAENLTLTVLE